MDLCVLVLITLKYKIVMSTSSKIALITGGSRGLGRDMAMRLAEKGTDLLITYHSNKDQADEVVENIRSLGRKAMAFRLDTRQLKDFDGFFQELSAYLRDHTGAAGFDFLINNAGTALYEPFATTSEEQFDAMVNIHFKGVFFLTQKALPYLNPGGRIVNISSGLARFALAGSSAYGAMKGAVEVWTRYLAKELGPRGIAANVVAPGAIATDFGGGHIRDDQEANARVASVTALGRVGQADDIGGVVAFLCSDDAKWISGQRIEVSGGMML